MSQTFQDLYELYEDHTGDDSAANTTMGKGRINDTHKELLALHDWYFAETTEKFTTAASDYQYNLPYNYGRMVSVRIKIGDVDYVLTEVSNPDQWQSLHTYRETSTSDYPIYFHITGDSMEIFPIPTSAGDTDNGTFHYVRRVVDMAADDYTTGTITTLANGGTAITGNGSTWTAAMVNRHFKIDADYQWYEISAFTSTTAITLKKAFQGTAISAGSASYTIGEMALIPEDYHQLLWQQPVALYWAMKKEPDQSAYYQALYEKGKKDFFNAYSKRTRSQIIQPIRRYRTPLPDAVGANRWSEQTILWSDPNEFHGGS
jgi:hypothetical protein